MCSFMIIILGYVHQIYHIKMLVNFCAATIYSLAVIIISVLIYLVQIQNYLFELACYEHDVIPLSYDYIVVGAGSAGSIVANRLSEDPNVQVLLIEAGTNSSSLLDIPFVSPMMQLTDIDWGYKTTPQQHACYGLDDNSSRWPMGRIVGGTSRLNYMMYVRGHSRDYDMWSERGNTNWGFSEHALHYFKKSEQHHGMYRNDTKYHSKQGRIVVSDLHFATSLADAVLEAGRELGFQVRDINGKNQSGFMKTQVTMYKGRRWSSEYGYLGNYTKSNMKILNNALVAKVLLHSKFEAYGVKVIRLGKVLKLRARKAVILSAGAIGTPKILLKSGIGPKEHLDSLKIPVAQDLPVGKNLQDHITTGMDLVLLNQSLSLNLGNIASPKSLWAYIRYGAGPWTTPGCEALGLVHSRLAKPETEPPDIQLMALPMGISSDHGVHLRHTMGVTDKIWAEYFSPLRGQQVASLIPVLLHPRSRGEVLLRSKSVWDPPIINPNYLSHPADVDTLFEGILLMKKMINTKAFEKLGAELYNKTLPGCEEHKFDSSSYWRCYIRHLTFTSYHPAGTCRMGPPSDPSAVVDVNLQVHKTNRLFVIDASVMPSLPSGNINAAVMMIAEKGADLIKINRILSYRKLRKIDYFLQNIIYEYN